MVNCRPKVADEEWHLVATNTNTSGRRMFLDIQVINKPLCDKINFSGKEPQHQQQQYLQQYLGPNSTYFISFQTISPKVKREVLNKGTYHSLS